MHEPMVTERLRLRPFTEDDLPELHAMWSDPAVGPWVGGTHTTLSESVEELGGHLRHQARHGFSLWAVEERSTQRLVGEVGLQLLSGEGPEVEVGWCIVSAAWGRGYATEAAQRWFEAGYAELGLDRIVAVVLPSNERSRGLCAKLGMSEAGTRNVYGAEHVLYERLRQEV